MMMMMMMILVIKIHQPFWAIIISEVEIVICMAVKCYHFSKNMYSLYTLNIKEYVLISVYDK